MFIKLRPATLKDAEDLLKWKNDDTMRKYTIADNAIIKMEDHLKWLYRHIDRIYIIENMAGESMGDIRFEDDEMALKIDPRFRGKGVGVAALTEAKRMFDHLIGNVVNGNVASMRLFTKAGFKIIDYKEKNDTGYYVFEYKA